MIYWRSALILDPVAYAYKEVLIGFLALSGCSSNFYHTMAVQGHKRLCATSGGYEVPLKGMFEKKKWQEISEAAPERKPELLGRASRGGR